MLTRVPPPSEPLSAAHRVPADCGGARTRASATSADYGDAGERLRPRDLADCPSHSTPRDAAPRDGRDGERRQDAARRGPHRLPPGGRPPRRRRRAVSTPAADADRRCRAGTFTPMAPRTGGGVGIQVGDVLNHIFEVKRFIARGGMGEVFEGVNVNTDERVAIKVMLPALAADPNVQAMFRKEARTLTRLSHPALVQYRVLAQEPQLGVLYIVTEFIDGANLSDVLGDAEAPTRPTCAALLAPAGRGAARRARARRDPPRHVARQRAARARPARSRRGSSISASPRISIPARRRSSATASPASSTMSRPSSSAISIARSGRGPTSTASALVILAVALGGERRHGRAPSSTRSTSAAPGPT